MDFIIKALDLAFLGDSTHEKYTVIEFAIVSSVYGLLIVLLDFCATKGACRPSTLKLSYAGYKTFFIIFLWGLGAGIAGLFGAGAGIFEISRTACIFVGVGWPLVLPRLLAASSKDISTEKVPTE
ncbi:hypothetical protein [Enterovibrio norvegicus]|uniref:hypothetical protein n=1 Tax=Enterovibrio norvegicus TaxID=188144 RepID=UPI000C8387DB|nr:hypothetical protein [Enterovibrio norvegicus]PMN69686.1 hypothetical protein BCT27_20345 [Enterovibrio norvegicus]